MAFESGNIVKNTETVYGTVKAYDPSKHPEGGPQGISGPPGARQEEIVEIPPGFTGEVLSSDDISTIAIYPIHTTGKLEPMLIKVEDFTKNFKRVVRHNPFIWQRGKKDLDNPGKPLDFMASLQKQTHWLDGYYGCAIDYAGEFVVCNSESDYHPVGTHRGLFNKTTGDLLHLTGPGAEGDYGDDAFELARKKDVIPLYDTFLKDWVRAITGTPYIMTDFGAYVWNGNKTPEWKSFSQFGTGNYRDSIMWQDHNGGRIEDPFEIIRLHESEPFEPEQLQLFSALQKQGHWLDGYKAATLDVENEQLYIAPTEGDFHGSAMAQALIQDPDSWYENTDDIWDDEDFQRKWQDGDIHRGLYNPVTQDMLVMSEGSRYDAGEMVLESKMRPRLPLLEKIWREIAADWNIPIKTFGAYVIDDEAVNYNDKWEEFEVKPGYTYPGHIDSVKQHREKGIQAPFKIIRNEQEQLQLFAALANPNDPLDRPGLDEVVNEQEVPWWTMPREMREQAVANALRVGMLSPLKLLKFNAVHYQDISHIPADETDINVYLDALGQKREKWNQRGQVNLFGDPEEVAPFDPKNAEAYAGYIHKHLDYIVQISQHIDELTDAAEEDIMSGGQGYIWRNALRKLKLPGANSKVASFAWLLLAPKSSELATIDTHMIRALEADERMVANPEGYEHLERELQEAKNAIGYHDMPLGQFQWGLWDYVRTPPDETGYHHQNHGAMRVLNPTPYNEINWHTPANAARERPLPDWWLKTKEVRDPLRMEWELKRKRPKPAPVEDDAALKLFAAIQKKSHWLEGYIGAAVSRSGKVVLSNDEGDFHPDGSPRGLYNPETKDLLHMTMASSGMGDYDSPAWEMDDIDTIMAEGGPEYFQDIWLKAADKAGLEVKSFGCYVWNGKGDPSIVAQPDEDPYQAFSNGKLIGAYPNSESWTRTHGVSDPYQIIRPSRPEEQLKLFEAALQKDPHWLHFAHNLDIKYRPDDPSYYQVPEWNQAILTAWEFFKLGQLDVMNYYLQPTIQEINAAFEQKRNEFANAGYAVDKEQFAQIQVPQRYLAVIEAMQAGNEKEAMSAIWAISLHLHADILETYEGVDFEGGRDFEGNPILREDQEAEDAVRRLRNRVQDAPRENGRLKWTKVN